MPKVSATDAADSASSTNDAGCSSAVQETRDKEERSSCAETSLSNEREGANIDAASQAPNEEGLAGKGFGLR